MAKKRQTVKIDPMDEEYLKSVIAGDIPRTILENTLSDETKKEVIRKRKETKDYEGVFLERKESTEKRQTYISKEVYNKISRFLPVISSEISITGYLDNILIHHLKEYQDEINDLYDKNYKKPL